MIFTNDVENLITVDDKKGLDNVDDNGTVVFVQKF